jgi:hypothetical protein
VLDREYSQLPDAAEEDFNQNPSRAQAHEPL